VNMLREILDSILSQVDRLLPVQQDMTTLFLLVLVAPLAIRALPLLFRLVFRPRAPRPFAITSPYVIDGDTLATGDLRIRIWGIDAPETGQRQGDAARRHMIRLLSGRTLKVFPIELDKYGRVVARLEADGQDVGKSMVADGYAIACTDFTRAYAGVMRRARRSGKGLWRHGAIQNPGAWRKSHG